MSISKKFHLQLISTFSIAILIFSTACGLPPKPSSPTSNCQETRGALDVGSGSTKIKVAIVDHCVRKIVRTLAEDQVQIAFKQNLNADGQLTSEFIKESAGKILVLAELANRLGVPNHQIAVVATQAARETRNIDELRKILGEKNLNFTTISQQDEASIGHLAAALASQLEASDFTSLDIGGGSFQLVNGGENPTMLGGHLASVSFKNHVLLKIQNRNSSQSPNPIRPHHASVAIDYATQYARRLKQSTGKFEIKKTVIGIGGVLGSSIRNQLEIANSDTLEIHHLETAIPKLIKRTPKELQGPYADTETTNLLLVLGLLKGLEIDRVKIFKANLTDGVLLNPQFFPRLAK